MEYGEYEVHDYRESLSSYITGMGTVSRSLNVQYWIGPHGPYKDTFVGNEATPDNIARTIQARIGGIRAVMQNVKS